MAVGEMGKQIIQRQTKRNERIKMVNLKASARRMRRTERQFEVFFHSLFVRSVFFFCSGENANPIEDARSMLMMFFLWLTKEKSENQHTEGEKKWILNLTENFCGDLKKFLIKFSREKVFSSQHFDAGQIGPGPEGNLEKKIASPTQQSRHRQRQTLCQFLGGPVSSSEQERKDDTTRRLSLHKISLGIMESHAVTFLLVSFLCCCSSNIISASSWALKTTTTFKHCHCHWSGSKEVS